MNYYIAIFIIYNELIIHNFRKNIKDTKVVLCYNIINSIIIF